MRAVVLAGFSAAVGFGFLAPGSARAPVSAHVTVTPSEVHGLARRVAASPGAARPASRRRVLAKPIVPKRGAYFGAYVSWSPHGGTSKSSIARFESMVKRTLGIHHRYQSWSARFPTSSEEGWDWAHRAYSMESWSDTDYSGSLNFLDAINNGSQDAVIRARAKAVRRWRHPIFIRFLWEMNVDGNAFNAVNSSDPGTHNGTRKYIEAWRHVYSIFRAEGARNAAFVWCPDYYDDPQEPWNHYTQYYPGDAYVQWVCADGYNSRLSKWRSLMTINGNVYADYPQKPFMIGETSSVEDPDQPNRKAAWILQASKELRRYPRVKAWVWFHHPQGHNARYDWQVNTSESALNAYIAAGAAPYFDRRARRPPPRK